MHINLSRSGTRSTESMVKMSPKSNNNVSRQIAGGPATWRREDKDHHIRVQIDKNYSVTAVRKGFSYRNTQPHQPGCKWTMYEYSLPSLSEVTVLCQLRRKDNDKTHQSTQKNKKRKRAGVGSTVIESFTSEAVDHHPESEVSADSSLSSDWIQSFPPAAQQAHPTCSLIHENRIQMIPNTFFMDCFY
uniref:NAC domain-containing protein n=1 Tax=Salix viminalis TaxID=40686 RepID=A0A6N2N9X8_SALVM